MKNYINTNATYWQSPYNAPYVESFIFRLDGRVLKKYNAYEDKSKFNVLDFGCGQGSHVKYFEENGFNAYGVDISKHSVEIAKKKLKNSERIKLIEPEANENDVFFGEKFDLIVSSQVLYYLSDSQLQKRLISFKNMLNPNGYVFFTMMSDKSWYKTWLVEKNQEPEDGLYEVEHTDDIYNKRVNKIINKHYINFTNSKEHLKEKFQLFKPIEIGDYDLTYNENESEHHYMFFGQLK